MKLQTCPGQILQGQASFFFLVRRPLGGCCGPGPDSRGEGGGSLARGPGQGFGAKCQFLFELARWGTPSPPGICPGGGGRQGPPGHVVVEIRVRPCRRPAAPSMDASSPALPSPSPPSPSAPPLPPPPPTFLAEAAVDPNGQCVFLCIIASQIQPMIYYQGGP